MVEERKCPKCGLPYTDRSNFGEQDANKTIGTINHRYDYHEYPGGVVVLQCREHCFITKEEWDKLEEVEGRKVIIDGAVRFNEPEFGDIAVFSKYYDGTLTEHNVLADKLADFDGEDVVITIRKKVPNRWQT